MISGIGRERLLLKAQGLDIHTREEWSAVEDYTSERTVFEPVAGFFLHISVTLDHGELPVNEHADMRLIEHIGQERFGIGFPYNAAVFDTGRLYEGQPLTRRGAHTVNDEGQPGFKETGSHGSLNYWYRAICLPQMLADDVTDAQVDQIAKWAAAQVRSGMASRLYTWNGHRDVSAKSCPGDTGYARLPEIRYLTEYYVKYGLHPDPKKEDDMFLYRTSGKATFFCHAGKSVGLNEATDMPTFQQNGVPLFQLDDDTYQKFRERYPGA